MTNLKPKQRMRPNNDHIRSFENAANMLIFLSEHLVGRMGDGARAEMVVTANDVLDAVDQILRRNEYSENYDA